MRVKPKPERVEPRKIVAKPVPRAVKPVPKFVKPEARLTKVDARHEKQAAQPLPDGLYELSPLMTRMVEAELQDIMIKVWQELPDHPSDGAEELVVDKLRNKAGDDLRNALGLNITKRLLNVHNPLFVKIQFTGKPEKVHLSAFLKKYNFNAFKRIESTVNTFAAQVRTIADFDRICATKDIRCGDIRVTVNPCYRFTKRPANLRTCFNNDENDEDGDNTENKHKDINMKEMCGIEDKQRDTQPIDTKHSDNSNTDKNEKEKPKVIEEQKAPVKLAEKQNASNKSDVEQPKAALKQTIETQKSTPNTRKVTTEIENKVINKQIISQSAVTNKIAGNSVTTRNKASPVKVAKGNIAASKPNVQSKKVGKVEDDFDELDDYDILALMSGGIVLDECCGSDDE